jgi:threonyl-tRNA synthetase
LTAISNGFYYDIDFEDQKLQKLTLRKLKIAFLRFQEENMNLNRPVSKADALELYKDNVYKTEMITNLEDGTITFCDHDTLPTYVGGHPEYRYYQSVK